MVDENRFLGNFFGSRATGYQGPIDMVLLPPTLAPFTPQSSFVGTCILWKPMGIPPALWIWWFHRFFCSILAKKIEWLNHRILMNPSHLNPKPWLSTGSHLGAVFNVGGRGLTFPRLEELEGFEHVGLKPPIGSSAAHCRFLRGPRSSGEPGLIWRCHEGRYCSQRGRQVFHVFFWTS